MALAPACTNVLLIDSAVKDYQVFVDAVNPSTFPIVYSSSTSKEELLDVLRSNFTTISRIGLAFEAHGLLDNAPLYDEQGTAFIQSVINAFSVKNIDYLACNTLMVPEWKAYYAEIATTGVIVGASDNSTGNLKYGGDWIMESTGQDIEAIYFTEKIEYYRFLLGSGNHSFVIDTSGTLYATGNNNFGQLGIIGANRSSLTRVDIPGVVAVSCGDNYSLAIKADGTLWATGSNQFGQLGGGDSRSSFTQVTFSIPINVTAVACGYAHSLVVDSNARLWTSGLNIYGQLGSGGGNRNFFTGGVLFFIKTVACGFYHSFALGVDGNLWAAGMNNLGQLGTGDKTDRNSFTQIFSISDVKAVACGSSFTVALKSDGTLWATGENSYGQLGDGTTTNRSSFKQVLSEVEAVSCGANHTLAIKSDGTVWATGYNGYGQLGSFTTDNRSVFTKVTELSSIVAISSSYFSSLALTSAGDLWTTGDNSFGELGNGTTLRRNNFLAIKNNVRAIQDSTVVNPPIPRLPASTFDGITAIPQIGGMDISLNYNSSFNYYVDVYTYSAGYFTDSYTTFKNGIWQIVPQKYVADPKFTNVPCSVDVTKSPIVIRGLSADVTHYFVVSARTVNGELYNPSTITSRTTAATLNTMAPSIFLKGVPLAYFAGSGLNLTPGTGTISLYPGNAVDNNKYAVYVALSGGAGGSGGSIPVTNYEPNRNPQYIVQLPIPGGNGGNGGSGTFIFMGALFGKQTVEYKVGFGGLDGVSDTGMLSGMDGGRLIYGYNTAVFNPRRAFAGSSGTETRLVLGSIINATGGEGGGVASLSLLPNNAYWGTIIPAKNDVNGTVTPFPEYQRLAGSPGTGLAPGGDGNIFIKTSLLRTSESGGSQTFNILAGQTVMVTLFCQSNRINYLFKQTTFSGGAIMFSYTYPANGTLVLTNKDGNSNCSATMGNTSVTTLQRYNSLPVSAAITGTVTEIWYVKPYISYYDNIVYNLNANPNKGGYWEFSVWDASTFGAM
jgi:alpha-tubulin suppressor-like RCC1 family protein